ncbi:MAG: DJ-1/PfpI family protein [Eggerthellaceae bacterium]|jgi:protease I
MLDLDGMKVMELIAPDGFRDEEYAQTHAALAGAKADVQVVSTHKGVCHGKLGSVAHAHMTLDDAVNETWDCIVLIGGPGATCYIDDERVEKIARTVAENGKVIAAICLAPVILSHAGLLDGVDATVFPDPSYEKDLEEHGAHLVKETVVVGKNNINGAPVVTGNGPDAAFAFGLELTNVLRGPADPFGL